MQKEKLIINIGKKVREIRKKKGLSSDKLGELIGKDGSFIRRLETGRIKNIPEEIEDIANVLGVPVSEIIGEPEKPKEKTLEDIAWEMVNLYLEKTGQKVSDKTKRKMYEFTLHKLKQAEGDMEKVIKLLAG